MGIFRGEGGSGDATTDAIASQVSVDSASASASATSASNSATASASSASDSNNSYLLALGAKISAEFASSAASTSETNASSFATQAGSSATSASFSASDASSSSLTAGLSASSAVAAKIAAETAKTAAETAETNAATSAGTASTKAGEASTSATNASNSASLAGTRATSASNDAASAESSATSAASVLTSINAFYLGSASSNPTVDGNGNAVTAGDWYFNTSDNTTRIYTGSTWNILESVTSTSVAAAGALMDSEVTNLAQVKSFDSSDYATSAQGTTADNALPKAGGAVTGAITTTSTFDGRDVGTDGTKLDGIEALADVTDEANVTAAGALMDSEVTNLSQVKAFDSSDYATSAQGSTADSAMQNLVEDTSPQLGGNLDLNSNNITGTGNITTTGTLQTSSSVIVGGDLTVSGTTTTVNTETINLADNNIVLNSNHTGAPSQNSGITVERGTSADKVFQWNETNDYWEADDNFHVGGNISLSGTVDGRDLVTDGDKLDLIEASADVTDTVNVTSAGALMDSEVTNLAQVKAFDSADYATAAQGTTADSALQNVVEDTTPQLGGDLASNGNDVVFADSDKALFGADSDLQIYHDGSNSVIKDSGTGDLRIGGSTNVQIWNDATSKISGNFNGDGAATLYNNGSAKLATTATGIDVTGTVTADALTVSGNLLVGKTSAALAGAGTALLASGTHNVTADGDTTLQLNRLTSDGAIATFFKDGTTVGSVGTRANYIKIGNGDTHLLFNSAADAVTPEGASANRDAAIDLGRDSSRFKDLYLSGDSYLGGDVIAGGASGGKIIVAGQNFDSFETSIATPSMYQTGSGGSGIFAEEGHLVIQPRTNNSLRSVVIAAPRSQGPTIVTEERLRVSSSGIDVTGDVVTDGLTVAGDVSIDSGTIKLDGNYPVGTDNVAIGDTALDSIGSGALRNVAIGSKALTGLTTGDDNIGIGYQACLSSSTNDNIAIGNYALDGTDSGTGRNIAIGKYSMTSNLASGCFANTCLGYRTGNQITSGNDNTLLGYEAGVAITTGSDNVAIGKNTLDNINTESFNTAVGAFALGTASASVSSTAVGQNAGGLITSGSKNTLLGRYNGNQDGLDIRTLSNRIVISDGDSNIGLYVDNSQDAHFNGNVIAYSTTISDRRLKSDITNISNALDKVGQINGVTFVRNNNGEKAAGIVAQEIMEVLPEAVKSQVLPLQTGEQDKEYYVVEYDAVTGLLVEAVKELKARVEALESK